MVFFPRPRKTFARTLFSLSLLRRKYALGDCEPELPGWSQCLSYLLSVRVLLPPPGLTMLSSFPVKADRAEGACVDAAPDTLGTTQCSHGLTTLHAPALPAY